MIGLLFIVVYAGYLALAIWLTWLVVRAARRRGKSGWRWGAVTALFFYLLVFWDHIPTLLVYRYECANNTGFWVYQTPEQWIAEHPTEVSEIQSAKDPINFKIDEKASGFWINSRFKFENRSMKFPLLPVRKSQIVIVDSVNEKTLVELVNFISYYPTMESPISSMKLWMNMDFCGPSRAGLNAQLRAYGNITGTAK